MTHSEAVLVSAYTGFLLTKKRSDVHIFCQKILNRPILAYEFSVEETLKEIREKCKPMIIKMIEGEQMTEYIEKERLLHGKWVWNPHGMDWGLGAWQCSECHNRNDNLPMDEKINPLTFVGSKYCPNCGAKMDLE